MLSNYSGIPGQILPVLIRTQTSTARMLATAPLQYGSGVWVITISYCAGS